jgi:4-amino-4-deoxy-L-arabinose transferase-like glycosyltransferase
MAAIGLSNPILLIILVVLVSLITIAALRKISKITLALLIILVIGTALRLRWIDQPYIDTFSWRQSSTAMIAENYFKTNANILYPEVNWSGPGPNYQGREFQTVTYIAMVLYRILGQQDWIGRTVAVAFGVWGIFALYKLVALAWDKKLALVSAAFMAILPASVFIERSFLPDPAMVALMTTSLWLFIQYLKNDRLLFLVLAGLTGALGVLTKLPGLIIGLPALYALVVLLPQKQNPGQRLLKICLTGLLSLLPVILYYLWARRLALLHPPHHFAGSGNWIWDVSVTELLDRYYFVKTLFRISANWLWTIPVLVLALIGFGFLVFSWWANYRHGKPTLKYELPLLFPWWLIAGAIYYSIGAKELVKNPWNLHIVTPAIAALSALAIAIILGVVQRRTWRPAAVVIITGILILLWSIGFNQNLRRLYKAHANDDYLLGIRLQELSEPGDMVVTISDALGEPTAIYYSQRRGWIYPPARPGDWADLLNNENEAIQEMARLRGEGADWLGIDAERKEQFWEAYPQLAAYIESASTMVEEHDEYVIFRFNDALD